MLKTKEGLLLKQQWNAIKREHNNLRKSLANQNKQRKSHAAERSFKKDPNKFAKRVFEGHKKHGVPTFSKETAQEYFAKTYRDEQRDYKYDPPPGSKRPKEPTYAFLTKCPTKKELLASVSEKRNGAAPSLNSITYVPFKKCPSLITFLHKIVQKIWREKSIPPDWAQAYIILISKSEDLSSCKEFRPIAITCTTGKIFFSVISDRLQDFLVNNGYIPRSIQKGFLSGVAGCVEHSFMLWEALREAKEHTRQIVTTWIDLANAYGSVRHNLIQFALNWYHVPNIIQELIFDYYENLMAKVETKSWLTGFFFFDIGLFQGYVLATILFLCVFQLLIDALRPHEDKLGYKFKMAQAIKLLAEAYADDLALIAKCAEKNQRLCDITDEWLAWTKTMNAKPIKCVTMAMKQFDKRIKDENFEPLEPLLYSVFNN